MRQNVVQGVANVIALQYQFSLLVSFSCRYIGVLEFGIIYFFWLENIFSERCAIRLFSCPQLRVSCFLRRCLHHPPQIMK